MRARECEHVCVNEANKRDDPDCDQTVQSKPEPNALLNSPLQNALTRITELI